MSPVIGKSEALVLGAVPKVHLLPPEVAAFQKIKRVRRLLITGVIASVALVGLGVGVASLGLITSNANLASAQSETARLVTEQLKYKSVVTVQSQVADITGLQPVAATGEVLWEPYIASLQATLPPNTSITSFTAALKTGESTSTDAASFDAAHVATVSIVADSPKSSISDWLDNMAKLKGFVGATPGSVILVQETGRYTVSVTLHVDADALANRFIVGKK